MRNKTDFRIGIIGGLGIETTCTLVRNINQEIREKFKFQPQIIMENTSISEEAEREIVTGKVSKEMKQALQEVVINLNHAKVDCIALPCNSVHVFFNELQKKSKKQILNIPKLCAKKCRKIGLKKVGILASQLTINQRIHQKELEKGKLKLILPSRKVQLSINKAILLILSNKKEQARVLLEKGISKLKNSGAEAVILGCTDIQSAIDESKCPLPLIDTLKVLEDEIVDRITIAVKERV